MTETIERIERGVGSRHDERWRVIVLNDSHNSFEGVAFQFFSSAVQDPLIVRNFQHHANAVRRWIADYLRRQSK